MSTDLKMSTGYMGVNPLCAIHLCHMHRDQYGMLHCWLCDSPQYGGIR